MGGIADSRRGNNIYMKIHHLEHSSFVLELEETVLIFDWYRGELPEFDGSKQIFVFASHEHHDHYGECIWELKNKYENVQYIIDEDVAPDAEGENILHVKPYMKYHVSYTKEKDREIYVETLLSTDEGVAFYIECEGSHLYFAGDLNIWYWIVDSDEINADRIFRYKKEIALLSDKTIDVAFVPVDPRLELHEIDAAVVFLDMVPQTKLLVPMHYWGKPEVIREKLKNSVLDSRRDRICMDDYIEL